jgi:hypothetical protein
MSLTKITPTVTSDSFYNQYSFRNLIMNGGMDVHQRGASRSSITTTGYYTVDRWEYEQSNSTTSWTQEVLLDAPAETGLRKSFKVTSNSSVSSISANQIESISQGFEGQSLQILKKGTSISENFTISFWVKSNVPGIHVLELADLDNTRSIGSSYSILTSNNWEKKTITFRGDNSGVLDNDNNLSFLVSFFLVVGSDFSSGSIQTSWGSRINANRAPGQINVASQSGNYIQFTGLQMELGNFSTPFERRPISVETLLCQRYYYRTTPGIATGVFCNGFNSTTTLSEGLIDFPVIMRIAPTALEQTGTAADYQIKYLATQGNCSAVPTFVNTTTPEGGYVQFTVASGLTAGQGCALRATNTAAFLGWSADL